MITKSFKNLIVWDKSVKLSLHVYGLTKKFSNDERFGLTSQMRRCSISIASNIAEGSRRGTKKDFIQFLRIADGSAAELETQIIIAKELYKDIDFSVVESLLEEIEKMLVALIKKLR